MIIEIIGTIFLNLAVPKRGGTLHGSRFYFKYY